MEKRIASDPLEPLWRAPAAHLAFGDSVWLRLGSAQDACGYGVNLCFQPCAISSNVVRSGLVIRHSG